MTVTSLHLAKWGVTFYSMYLHQNLFLGHYFNKVYCFVYVKNTFKYSQLDFKNHEQSY